MAAAGDSTNAQQRPAAIAVLCRSYRRAPVTTLALPRIPAEMLVLQQVFALAEGLVNYTASRYRSDSQQQLHRCYACGWDNERTSFSGEVV